MSASDSLADLRLLAKSLGLRGWTSLRKAQLVEVLEKHAKSLEAKGEIKLEEAKVEAPPKERRRDEKARQEKERQMKDAGEEIPPKLKPKVKRESAWMDYLADRRASGMTLKQSMADKSGYADFKAKWVKPSKEEVKTEA